MKTVYQHELLNSFYLWFDNFLTKKGDAYNKSTLDTKLFMNPNGNDISSLYMDDGYLFFQVNQMEKRIDNDSVDLEIKINEGKKELFTKK